MDFNANLSSYERNIISIQQKRIGDDTINTDGKTEEPLRKMESSDAQAIDFYDQLDSFWQKERTPSRALPHLGKDK
jgi:hypothetical protein